jgi:hypothetical protein
MKIFLKYCFDMLKPYYNQETYYIDKITTNLEKINGIIVIVIRGIIKKYSYEK